MTPYVTRCYSWEHWKPGELPSQKVTIPSVLRSLICCRPDLKKFDVPLGAFLSVQWWHVILRPVLQNRLWGCWPVHSAEILLPICEISLLVAVLVHEDMHFWKVFSRKEAMMFDEKSWSFSSCSKSCASYCELSFTWRCPVACCSIVEGKVCYCSRIAFPTWTPWSLFCAADWMPQFCCFLSRVTVVPLNGRHSI